MLGENLEVGVGEAGGFEESFEGFGAGCLDWKAA